MFDVVKSRSRRYSTQSALGNYYWLALLSGAKEEAASIKKLMNNDGFWRWQVSLYNTIYGTSDEPIATETDAEALITTTLKAQISLCGVGLLKNQRV